MRDSADDMRDELPEEAPTDVLPAGEDGTDGEKTVELAPDPRDEREKGAEGPAPAGGDTVRRPAVDATAPRPAPAAPEEPRLRDVAGTVGGYVRGRVALLAGLVRRHRAATAALALIGIVAVFFLAVALSRAAALPDSATIAEDARELFSPPEYAGGTYGEGSVLVTRNVDVRSVRRSETVPEGMDAEFGASGYAVAEVVISYAGDSVSADRGATIGYALVDETWVAMGGAREEGVTWRATAGVSQNRALSNLRLLLGRAEEGERLVELYEDSERSVISDSFDEQAQTDTLVVECVSAGTFFSYSCELTVTFSFEQADGTWSVASVEASEGALERSLEGLLGTWAGTFQSQETDGTRCLAGRAGGLSLTIERAGGSEVSGTLSGVAHYHAHPSSDAQSCDGDLELDQVPFTATLVEGDENDVELRFEATLPEDVDGVVSVSLTFAAGGDHGHVTACVTTSYVHETALLFFPYEETLTYTDIFALTRTDQ